MKPRVLAMIIVLSLMMGTAFADVSLFTDDGESTRSSRAGRVISLVYDDSGSMVNVDSAAKASNALLAVESLVAMLDPNIDTLYITFMSQPFQSVRIPLENGTEACWKLIANSIQKDTTPAEAIQTAIEALEGHTGKNGDQYWLVVFTDGLFSDLLGYTIGIETANTLFSEFLKTQMPNRTLPHCCYLAIGKNTERAADADRMNIYPNAGASIDSSEDIIETMRAMGNLVCGRTVPQVSSQGTVITFDTSLPSFHIDLFIESVENSVISADVDGVPLDFTLIRNASVPVPIGITAYKGTAAPITAVSLIGSEDVIPAGKVTVTLSQSGADALVTCEPALELQMNAEKNPDQTINVNAILTPYHSSEPVDPALLPENTTFSMTATSPEGKVIAENTTGLELQNIQFAKGTVVTAQALLGGTGAITQSRYLADVLSLKPGSGSYEWTTDTSSVINGSVLGVFDVVYENTDGEDLTQIQYNVESEIPLVCRPVEGSGGTQVELVCEKHKGFVFNFNPFNVTIVPSHEAILCNSTTITLQVKPSLVLLLSGGGLGLALLVLIFGYSAKRRFPRHSYLRIQEGTNGLMSSSTRLDTFGPTTLIPFVREKRKVGNYTVIASSGTNIMLERRQIPTTSYYLGQNGQRTIAAMNYQTNRAIGNTGKDYQYLPLDANNNLFVTYDGKTGKTLSLSITK